MVECKVKGCGRDGVPYNYGMCREHFTSFPNSKKFYWHI